jgi:hypothetical protein
MGMNNEGPVVKDETAELLGTPVALLATIFQ